MVAVRPVDKLIDSAFKIIPLARSAMKKFLIQLVTFLVLFFGTWYLLSRIPFTNVIDFKKLSRSNEHKIGLKFIDYMRITNTEITSDSVKLPILAIKNKICRANNIDTSQIEIYVFKNSEINAFALPGNILVIYSGIIEYSKTPEELGAVMAHEIAHIEKRHVVKRLSKEVGLGILAQLAGANSDSKIIQETMKRISSSAFDQKMEKDADLTAVGYMAKANIDPVHFANMMTRLSKKTDIPEGLQWLNTHPNSKDRAAYILKQKKEFVIHPVPLMNDSAWHQVQKEAARHIE